MIESRGIPPKRVSKTHEIIGQLQEEIRKAVDHDPPWQGIQKRLWSGRSVRCDR